MVFDPYVKFWIRNIVNSKAGTEKLFPSNQVYSYLKSDGSMTI
jgi:hypothetical protein